MPPLLKWHFEGGACCSSLWIPYFQVCPPASIAYTNELLYTTECGGWPLTWFQVYLFILMFLRSLNRLLVNGTVLRILFVIKMSSLWKTMLLYSGPIKWTLWRLNQWLLDLKYNQSEQIRPWSNLFLLINSENDQILALCTYPGRLPWRSTMSQQWLGLIPEAQCGMPSPELHCRGLHPWRNLTTHES